MQFAVGFKLQGETGHDIVDAEDALIAALKVKTQRPERSSCTFAGIISGATHATLCMVAPERGTEGQSSQTITTL